MYLKFPSISSIYQGTKCANRFKIYGVSLALCKGYGSIVRKIYNDRSVTDPEILDRR